MKLMCCLVTSTDETQVKEVIEGKVCKGEGCSAWGVQLGDEHACTLHYASKCACTLHYAFRFAPSSAHMC